MGNFLNNAITNVGRMLLADVQAGAVFTPTRIVIGSGSMTGGATIQEMTDVITPVKSLVINKKKRTPDGKCVFGGVYTNEEITEAFYFRELALYAKAVYLNEDGSVKSESAETLYSYGSAGSTADYMPAYSTSTVVEKQIDLVVWVGNDTQVVLTIESGIYITREDFDSHAMRHALGGEDPITPESIGATGKKTAEGGEIFNDYKNNEAIGEYSHVQGYFNKATADMQDVSGKYSKPDNTKAVIVGNGGERKLLSGETSGNLINDASWKSNMTLKAYREPAPLDCPAFTLKPNNAAAFMKQYFDCEEYSLYCLNLKYKCLSGYDSSNNVYAGFWFYNAQGQTLAAKTVRPVGGDNSWVDISISAVAPVGATSVKVDIGNNSGGYNLAYNFADINVTKTFCVYAEDFDVKGYGGLSGWGGSSAISTTKFYRGNGSLLLSSRNGIAYSPTFPVIELKEYNLRFWKYAPYGDAQIKVEYYRDVDADVYSTISTSLDKTEDFWELQSVSFVPPQEATKARVVFARTGYDFYVDDLMVTDESTHTCIEYSNAYTLDWEGNAWFAGNVIANCQDVSLADFNTITKNGWYKFKDAGENGFYLDEPARMSYTGYSYMFVIGQDSNSLTQFVFVNNTPPTWGCIVKRTKCPGSEALGIAPYWSEWEWINPPMTRDIEYRTTERFGYITADGICKPLAVYVKAIMIPNLPLGEEDFGHGINLADKPIAIDYYGSYATTPGSGSHQAVNGNEAFNVLFTRHGIRVTSKQEAVGHNLQLVLKYAKEVEA